MLDSIHSDAEAKLNERISYLKTELAKLRVGQATPSLIEDIPVEAYETILTLKEVGAISAPEPTLLVVSCWDDSVVEAVASAIRKAELGLNPAVDGKIVRIPIPSLTDERREILLKEVGEVCEKVRIDVRQIRQEKIKTADDLKEAGKIGEDEHELFKKHIQELIDKTNKQVEDLREKKEESLTDI